MAQPRYDGPDFQHQINHLKRASNYVKLVKKWIDSMPQHATMDSFSKHLQNIIVGLNDTVRVMQQVADSS